jgi:hypothetical protein
VFRTSYITNSLVWFITIILIILTLFALGRVNYTFSEQNPGGTDFLVHWMGARELLMNGISPYSDLTALKIQVAIYGRPARPGEHEFRVAYPLYSTAIFAPFAMLSDFTLARALWMTSLQAALLALVFLSLQLTAWRPGILVLALLLVFSLLWYHALRGIINGNAVILVAFLIGAALLALKSGKDELAGVLLAFTTIKPQVVVILLLFIFIWVISSRRWPVIFWFLVTLVFLTLAGLAFVPDWPLQNLREVLRYPGYNPPGTPGAAFQEWWPGIGARLGWGLTIFMAALLLVEWWQARKSDFPWFLWAACLTLVASQWIGIQTDPGNFIVLFVPMILVLATWEERWGKRGRLVIIMLLAFAFVGLWALFLYTVDLDLHAQQHPIMFFPLPAMLLVGLYWVRWWAIRPSRLLVENLRTSGSI